MGMHQEQQPNDIRNWFIFGLFLCWLPVIPVMLGLLGSVHTRTDLTSLHDVAGSVIIAFRVYGLAVTALSQVAAIVFLFRLFPFGHRVVSTISICWSGLVLALSGVCIWMLLGEVVVR